MREHLVFMLTSALGSMGDLAGHERRGSWSWPGRSAILGLCGAALGLRREDDFSALDALGMAVATFSSGTSLRDYHTIETVPSAAAKHPQSRADALRRGKGRTSTTITLRDYRMGPLYGVALWGEGLEALEDALRRPAFTLYLGRKSCPLAAPLDPQRVDAPDAASALSALRLPPWRAGERAQSIATEEDLPGGRVETRHDRPTDRCAWHFAPRAVRILACDIAPGVAA
ncbi:MAG: type I-E CRISPR-associated protein Cas5/CasD [Rhodobacteraceae bacterium]|nr:type I-E CRISPR-associated protein Cas5/CasD [Paracoccaceae bacterium]